MPPRKRLMALLFGLALLGNACDSDPAPTPTATPGVLLPTLPAEPNPTDVLAGVTPRVALTPAPETPSDEVLAPLRSAVAEFPEPPGPRHDVSCRHEGPAPPWCELQGLADGGAPETFEEFARLADQRGWVAESKPVDETTDSLFTRTQSWRRHPLRLAVSTSQYRGTFGTYYELAISQPRLVTGDPRIEDVRLAWREVTSTIEGYHLESCAYPQDLYTCSSTVPLSTTYGVFLNQVAQTLSDKHWMPTSERPVFEQRMYVWSFVRDGLICTIEAGPRGPASLPPFVHVRVARLPG